MFDTLSIGADNYFLLNGVPIQRNLYVQWYSDGIELRYSHNDFAPLLNYTQYDQLIDGATGAVFESFADLKTWIINNVFTKAGFATLFNKQFTIAAAPVGAQKPTGNTLQDDAFIGTTPLLSMDFNGAVLEWAVKGITFDSATGTFDFTAYGALVDGDIITVYYQK